MNNPLMMALIIESVAIIIIIAALFFLVRSQLKLKQDYQALNEIVRRNSNDLGGLCSAALVVDGRIASVDRQMAAVDRQMTDVEAWGNDLSSKIVAAEQSTHPYSVDIRKVRSGADVNELMQNSGLSHDEAALLIRLHGSKSQL
jgi:hypothetical protein